MFNIDEKPVFTRTVTTMVPKGEGHEPQTFKATFNALDDEEIDGVPVGDTEKVKVLLRKMVTGLEDIADAAGEAVPFSDELLEFMLKKSYVRIALLNAYFSGTVEGRSGN